MRLHQAFTAAALALVIAAPAHAATKSAKADANTCQTYQQRVDDAMTANPNAKKLNHAKNERAAGEKASA